MGAFVRLTTCMWLFVGAALAFHSPSLSFVHPKQQQQQQQQPFSRDIVVSPTGDIIRPLRLSTTQTLLHILHQHQHQQHPHRLVVAHRRTTVQRRSVGRGGRWDGDDIRWISKVKRRIVRRDSELSITPARTSLIVINLLLFIYQTVNTVSLIRIQNPTYWPGSAMSIISDTLLGATSIRGPLTTYFVHQYYYSQRQPHRFLTAGFLHGDILHLTLNVNALRKVPLWLETGLGTPLFLTTFLVSIVSGNIGHSISSGGTFALQQQAFCLGASGGICGLYGLLYVALCKMGRGQNAMSVLKSMLLLLLSGLFWDNVSNAAHLGGFVGGMVMGILCAPHYEKDYSMRRKNSLQVDPWPRDYRQMMGFGISPTKHGLVPLSMVWAVIVLIMASEPKFRAIPSCILRGLLKPGNLSSFS